MTRKTEQATEKTRAVQKHNYGGPKRNPAGIRLSAVAWSPDGKLVLSGNAEESQGIQSNPEEVRVVTVWDVASGKRLRLLKAHDGSISFVGFLPDSKRAVTAGGTTLKMWDVDSGKQLWSAKVSTHHCDHCVVAGW